MSLEGLSRERFDFLTHRLPKEGLGTHIAIGPARLLLLGKGTHGWIQDRQPQMLG